MSSVRVVAAVFLLSTTAAAVPTSVTYAGLLTENGAPVDGTVELVVELFADPTGGTAVFLESFSGLVVPDGDLIVELGLQEVLDDTVLDEPELFVQVTVDGQVLLPRARLSSVPYALRAQDAVSLSGLTADDITSNVADLQAQITALQTQLTTLQNNLTALASAGGPSVAFANITGLTFTGGLQITGGQASIATNGVTSTHIAADTIAAADIATGAVGTAEIADGSIAAVDIAGGTSSVLYVRNHACSVDTQVYSEDPGTCTTASCTGFPCQSPPCFFSCPNEIGGLATCNDAAAGQVCPAIQLRVFSN